jgi:hypothetical protein
MQAFIACMKTNLIVFMQAFIACMKTNLIVFMQAFIACIGAKRWWLFLYLL